MCCSCILINHLFKLTYGVFSSSSSSYSYPLRQEELKFTKVPLDLLHVGMPPGVHIWFKYENRDNPEKEVYLDEASIRKKIRGYVCICFYYE